METVKIDHIEYEVISKADCTNHPNLNIRRKMNESGIEYRFIIRRLGGKKLYTANQYKSGNFSKVC